MPFSHPGGEDFPGDGCRTLHKALPLQAVSDIPGPGDAPVKGFKGPERRGIWTASATGTRASCGAGREQSTGHVARSAADPSA